MKKALVYLDVWEGTGHCFIVDILGGTASGSRLNIFFFRKIYETQQGCYKKMKSDWLCVNSEQRWRGRF